jgi:PhnB protein
MNQVTPYLFFNGNCREVMNFYREIFGGEVTAMTYGETQGAGGCAEGAKDRIIHAALKAPSLLLLASDTPDDKLTTGDNIQLSLDCASLEEIEKRFTALSQGGSVFAPLHDTFWGAASGCSPTATASAGC